MISSCHLCPQKGHSEYCFRSTLGSLRNCDLFALCFTEICSIEYIQTHFTQIMGSIKCKENQNSVISKLQSLQVGTAMVQDFI